MESAAYADDIPDDFLAGIDLDIQAMKNEPNQYEEKGGPPEGYQMKEEKGKEKEKEKEMEIGYGDTRPQGGGKQIKRRLGAKEAYSPYGEEEDLDEWIEKVSTMLMQDISAEDISICQGRGGKVAYIEGSTTAVRLANTILGWENWSFLKKTEMVFNEKDARGQYKFVFRCDGTLVVKKGGITVVKQDVGVGSGQGGKAEDAIDTAIKSSVTDAMKRCLRLMGPALGGTVYKKSVTGPLTKGPIKFQ